DAGAVFGAAPVVGLAVLPVGVADRRPVDPHERAFLGGVAQPQPVDLVHVATSPGMDPVGLPLGVEHGKAHAHLVAAVSGTRPGAGDAAERVVVRAAHDLGADLAVGAVVEQPVAVLVDPVAADLVGVLVGHGIVLVAIEPALAPVAVLVLAGVRFAVEVGLH